MKHKFETNIGSIIVESVVINDVIFPKIFKYGDTSVIKVYYENSLSNNTVSDKAYKTIYHDHITSFKDKILNEEYYILFGTHLSKEDWESNDLVLKYKMKDFI